MIDEQVLRQALHESMPDAEPPASIWERVRQTIPGAPARRRLSRVTVASICAALVLTGSVAAASTSTVQELVDKMFRKTGVQLVEFTPEVKQQLPKTDSNGEPVSSTFTPVDPARVRELVHAEMKLPAYLPSELTGGGVRVDLLRKTSMSAVWWSTNTSPHDPASRKAVLVSMHTHVFGPGSVQGTSGPVTEVAEIKVSGLSGSAFKDNKGWNLLWAMENHQYEVVATGYSLEEAIKVAESLK